MAERYKIYEKLGAGGVGAVFRAYDSELKRWVAIKRLFIPTDAPSDSDIVAELRREADALASLRNPNIVTIFDVATDAEGLFMVMELLEGEDLADVVSRGPLHYDDFKELASQSLEGLLAAHQRHILHRDIKPENIKVERLPGGRLQSKIIDFGLARSGLRARKQTEDQEGTVMGSIYYMAPEQLTREPVDERTDLYALGCVFYEALSGRKAFDGDSMGTVIDKHVNHDLVPLHVVAPHVPPWLGAWVLRLMAQRPDDRPTNAQQAIEEFRAWEKMAAAPAMMPWMPYGYGQQAPGSYTQQMSGADTVPLQGYYQPQEEEAVYYAEPVVEVQEPVIEMGGHTSQLSRPKPATGRRPVGGQTAGIRTSSQKLQHSRSPIDAEPPKTKLYVLIGGGVLLVAFLGWFFMGRGGDGKSGGAASQSILGPSGPPPATFQLPQERIFPPVSDDIVVHLVPDTGVTTSFKNASGKLTSAQFNEPVVEWHDLSPLGNDNLMRAFEGNAANAPKRIVWPPPKEGIVGAKAGRNVLDFRVRDGQPVALNLTDPEDQKDKFPFGSASTRGERGLTLAIVFQADANKLPTRILTLSGEGDAMLSLSVDAQKRVVADYKNANSTGNIISKDIDPTQPCVVVMTWQASTGKTELRIVDAPGKVFLGSGSPVATPDAPMAHLQLGRVEDLAKRPAPPADQFSGFLADVVLYSSMLKTDQIQVLIGRALRDYYLQAPLPVKPAPKAAVPAPKAATAPAAKAPVPAAAVAAPGKK
jgi:hypothetical protein